MLYWAESYGHFVSFSVYSVQLDLLGLACVDVKAFAGCVGMHTNWFWCLKPVSMCLQATCEGRDVISCKPYITFDFFVAICRVAVACWLFWSCYHGFLYAFSPSASSNMLKPIWSRGRVRSSWVQRQRMSAWRPLSCSWTRWTRRWVSSRANTRRR